MVNKGGGAVIQVHNGSDYLIAACAAEGRAFISAGKRMFFRTESLSAGAVGAPAATIVNAAAKAIGAAFAGLSGHRVRHVPEISILSEHALRDIGLDQCVGSWPIPYDLLDLIPRALCFGHRYQR